MKRLLWSSLSVICIVALAAAGTPGFKRPIEFTLATTNAEPGPMSFTLVSSLTAAAGGLGGAAYSEECGTMNTWFGCNALSNNSAGNWNTAFGSVALFNNSTGNYNTASGSWTLGSNDTGNYNTASGASALYLSSTGSYNTASGYQALYSNITGSYNTALGYNAGFMGETGNYNIFIGANSMVGENDVTNTIVIGTHYQPAHDPPIGQNRTFIAGIVDTTLTVSDWPAVVGITPAGRLGIVPPELLPSTGPEGPPGPAGPTGEGLISGSLLFLRTGFSPPSGYTLLGTTDFMLMQPGSKKGTKLTVNVYQKP